MQFKTVIAPTMEDAVTQIRAVLGDEAILVSCVQEKQGVRVTAALDRTSLKSPPPSPSVGDKKGFQTIDAFCRAMEYHMPPTGIADQLMGTLSRLDNNRLGGGVSSCLNALISVDPIDFKSRSSVMVLGPAGVGKTVTLGKIASEYTLMGMECDLVSLDLKAGSLAQLETYGTAMGLSVHFLDSVKDLDSLLTQNRKKNIVTLIDTPGLNPLDPIARTDLGKMIARSSDDPILVIAGGLDPLDILDYIPIYQDFGCRHVIYTKADTARRLGGLLTALTQAGMTLSHISAGPWLGDQLIPATAEVLTDYLLSSVQCVSSFTFPQHPIPRKVRQ